MINKYVLLLTALSIISASMTARAMDVDTTVYAGLEEYQWEEYDPTTGAQLLKENGPRVRAGLRLAPQLQSNLFALDYDVSLYEGAVNYSSQTTDQGTGASIPTSSNTSYMGMDSHLDGIYTGFGEIIQPVLTLGFEGWRRSIDSRYVAESVGIVTMAGYTENWAMFYTKLGGRGAAGRFSWAAGLKLPFYVTNTVDFIQATVHPKGLVSGYAGMDYAFAKTWRVGLNYEGTRFGQSDSSNSIYGVNTVLQPKSNEDVFMLSLNKIF